MSASDVRTDEDMHLEAGLRVRPLGLASFRNTPRIGLAGSYSNSSFRFLRHL